MGIHDRDYMQAGPASGPLYRPGRLTWLIIAINVVLWIVYSGALNNTRGMSNAEQAASAYAWMREYLLLWPDFVFAEGRVWQLFTCMWMHDPGSAQHVIFNMLALFFFGRAVEMYLGLKRYLLLYILSGVFASVVYTVWAQAVGSSIPALGASGAVYAVLVWMALQQPKAKVYMMMVIPMPMWLAIGVFIVGMEFLRLGSNFQEAGSQVAHLAGALFGAGFWFFARRFALPSRTYASPPSRPPAAPSNLEDAHRITAMRMAMDRLLDKVHDEGVESLTDEEKAFLEQASRELRGR